MCVGRGGTDAMSTSDILDLVQESVVLRTRDGCITGWNSASEELYGWSRKDALGRPVHELLKTRRETVPLIEAKLRDNGIWLGDVVRRAANGTLVIVRLKCTPRGGDEIFESAIDISAQRRLEEALTRAEHRYYNVFQAMAVSFWELDFTAVGAMVQRLLRSGNTDLSAYFAAHPEFVREMIRSTRVIDINDQSVALFGRGNKEEMLANLEPYWPERSHPIYAASVVAAVQGLPHYATETRLTSLGGHEFDVRFTACFPPQMVQRGKLLIGIIDISADKKARTELETSERLYRGLFHSLPVPMVQLDRRELARIFLGMRAEGIEDLTGYFEAHPDFYEFAANSIQVVDANSRAIELFRARNASELLGPAARLWSESRATIQRAMAARFSGAERFEAEIKIRTLDGQLRDVLYVADYPNCLSRIAPGISCFIDISDRVKTQTMLAQLQAEFTHAARVAVLGELTASIAHEVNQPLGAILTNGEAALRWLSRPEPDLGELRALSNRTIADAQRAADIIRRIRYMALRRTPEQTPVALNGVVEEVMLFLSPELKRQGVRASVELASTLPDVMGDRVQLQQVFANLAVNAIQAMATVAERRLVIRTTHLDVGTIRADVEDTGPGIPEAQFVHLFESFFSTKEDGMGIGLAICRSIVEAHGGRIAAENLPGGVGARFRFTLPVAGK
jgi:PAS domain S-box-containing protein